MSDELVAKNRDEQRRYSSALRPGLENLGHNNYSNATLQALFACEGFRVLVILIGFHSPNSFYHNYLAKLFTNMVVISDDFFIPINFEEQLQLLNVEQDSYLFLFKLIRILETEKVILTESLKQEEFSSSISVFVSNIEKECTVCKAKSNSQIYITPLDVNSLNLNIVSIQQLCINGLRAFAYCGKCRNATNILLVKPEYFIIHLSHDCAQPKPKLIIDKILELDGEQYCIVACICYHRLTERNGYYYCYAQIAEIWYCFSDRIVTEIGAEMPSQDMLQNSYILFYKKLRPTFSDELKQKVDLLLKRDEIEIPEKYQLYPWLAKPTAPIKPSSRLFPQISISSNEDLMSQTLKHNKGLLNTEETDTCWMNSVLQALFHCEQFRAHVLIGGHSGKIHRALADYFTQMSFNKTDQCVDAKGFWQLFGSVHKEFSKHGNSPSTFCTRLLIELNDEAKQYANKVLFSGIIPHRDGLLSNDAFIQHLIAERNSYITRLFSIQEMADERCRYGHRNDAIKFMHSFTVLYGALPDDYIDGQYLDVQMLIDSTCRPTISKKCCDVCINSKENIYEYKTISRASNILIIYNFLFDVNRNAMVKYKLADLKINETLLVCSENYSCKAIIIGEIKDFGESGIEHVYTYARTDNEWWLFDDQEISKVSENIHLPSKMNLLNSKDYLYVLCYEKTVSIRQPTNLEDIHLLRSIGPFVLPSRNVALINRDSTTYMNSALQCLYHCEAFRNYIIYGTGCGKIHNCLQSLFVQMNNSEISVNADEIWRCFVADHHMFARKNEHDSQLFLNTIIYDLHKEMNLTKHKNFDLNSCKTSSESWNSYRLYIDNSYLVDLFVFLYATITKCNLCDRYSIIYNTQWIMTLHNPYHQYIYFTIQQMIDEFFKPRPMEINCSACGKNNADAIRWNVMSHLPNILLVKLDIFINDSETHRLVSIDPKIIVSEIIKVKGQQFRCRACICYRESHYYSLAKTNNHWHRFNDIVVQIESNPYSDGVPNKSDLKGVYVLFYEILPQTQPLPSLTDVRIPDTVTKRLNM